MRWKLTRLSRAFETRSPSRADLPDQGMQVFARRRGLARAREGRKRHVIEFRLHALEQVGDTLDECFDQACEQRGGRRACRRRALDELHESAHGRRVDVAVRDHAAVGQDKRDHAAFRPIAVELAAHRRRHVDRTAFLVEAAGRLDLLHLVARRHVDGQECFDRALFFRGGLVEVGPKKLVRELRRWRMLDPGVAGAGRNE